MNRAFIKWVGGKSKSLPTILEHLPEGHRLVEPFVGSGIVSLNADFQEYLLTDVNTDLINLWRAVTGDPETLVSDLRLLFEGLHPNDAEGYYKLRDKFNNTKDAYERAKLLMVLNRYGYNGLCRYNDSGGYNVPHGRYSKVHFPEREILAACEHFRKKHLNLAVNEFDATFQEVTDGDVVYCDPPYIPLSATASFTDYHTRGFGIQDHERLALWAVKLRDRGIPTLISNSASEKSRMVFKEATKVVEITVQRSIAADKNSRKKVEELLFIY